MKIAKWFAARGPSFVRARGMALLKRYGVSATKAQERIHSCMATLARYGCTPTFPTPGRVVQKHTRFIRELQDTGAEIAVHSYDHVDLRAYSPVEASAQLVKAVRIFQDCGIEVHGFRCPYLGYTEELIEALPEGLFKYSSNCAIGWSALPLPDSGRTETAFGIIEGFYQPKQALDAVCVPWMRENLVEIPVCVPDDLQLADGLHLNPEGVAEVWCHILAQTLKRGELFGLLFHPELAAHCEQGLVAVLQEARRLHSSVWIAALRDIAVWWREKAGFGLTIGETSDRLCLSFNASQRATILARGLPVCDSKPTWGGDYVRLEARPLQVPAQPRPFVGLAADIPAHVPAFLREQGYILDTSGAARNCSIYLDAATLDDLGSEVNLIGYIEASPGPLVRYARWPDGLKSALCISGDLDALTLGDYVSRLFV